MAGKNYAAACAHNPAGIPPACGLCVPVAYVEDKPTQFLVTGDETNPKDLVGVKKVSTFVFPSTALLHGSHAMMNGASKYGPYNWREKKVRASIYLDALERHVMAWKEREEIAEDSGVHHLGHALACVAIIIDAMETGNLLDDRPKNGNGTLKLLTRLNETIRKKD
jgi:hypothetical protein